MLHNTKPCVTGTIKCDIKRMQVNLNYIYLWYVITTQEQNQSQLQCRLLKWGRRHHNQ